MDLEELNGQQRTRTERLQEFLDSLNFISRVLKVRIPPELTVGSDNGMRGKTRNNFKIEVAVSICKSVYQGHPTDGIL
jgi:hypothetical protein